MELPKLTQYSRGAGCGCKIAPALLSEILKTDSSVQGFEKLLVGNNSLDDAAVYDLGNGTALISTTDFFMPIVDSAYDFGRISAANAISDVYAMGGKPVMALAILGWPIEKLPAALAQHVLEGARAVCAEANIPIAGGHSIDSTEPIFGLSVNGIIDIGHIKRNNTAAEGDLLFLTKAIGTGVLATAQKRGVLKSEHELPLIAQLVQLNSIGEQLGKIEGVTAMTDVTGFGLAGHLIELAEGSNLSAELYYSQVRIMAGVKEYLAQRIVPDATFRNWNGYGAKIAFDDGVDVMEAFSTLPDPQTNGGLLICVKEVAKDRVIELLLQNGYSDFTTPIGRITERKEKAVTVKK